MPYSAYLNAKEIRSSENRFPGIGTFHLHRKCTKNSAPGSDQIQGERPKNLVNRARAGDGPTLDKVETYLFNEHSEGLRMDAD